VVGDLFGPRIRQRNRIRYLIEPDVPAVLRGDPGRCARCSPIWSATPSSSPGRVRCFLHVALAGTTTERARCALLGAATRVRASRRRPKRACSAVLAGRQLTTRRVRRHRLGPRDQQAAGRDDGWRHRLDSAPGWVAPSGSPCGCPAVAAAGESGYAAELHGLRVLAVDDHPPSPGAGTANGRNWGMPWCQRADG